jgi:hypothetical protein
MEKGRMDSQEEQKSLAVLIMLYGKDTIRDNDVCIATLCSTGNMQPR